MKTKTNTLNELFAFWEKETKPFVSDGIFSECDFAPKRILFVLRDAHIVPENTTPPYDIRDIVNAPDGEGKTWNNIARWTQALLDQTTYPKVEKITPAILSSQLKRVAAINLKKKAGGSSAEEIKKYAVKDRDWIKKQIEIIDPDLIIACGTFVNIKRDVLENNKRIRCLIPGTSYRRFDLTINAKTVPLIEFYHPQFSGRNKELVEDMLKIRTQIWGMDEIPQDDSSRG